MIWAKQKLKTDIIYKILQKYKRLSYESNNESNKTVILNRNNILNAKCFNQIEIDCV